MWERVGGVAISKFGRYYLWTVTLQPKKNEYKKNIHSFSNLIHTPISGDLQICQVCLAMRYVYVLYSVSFQFYRKS